MVECTGLENRQAARPRGFESRPLRLRKRRMVLGDPAARPGFLRVSGKIGSNSGANLSAVDGPRQMGSLHGCLGADLRA